jgi:ABC-type spermidine/putrescine transport system permease subunit I
LLVLPPILVVAVFIGFPVLAAVAYSLGHGGGPNRVLSRLAQGQHLVHGGPGTVAAYREVFGEHAFQRNLYATVVITVVSVAVVLVLSWAIALYARLSPGRVARVVSALAVVPMFIPVVIASYAVLTFYSTDGFLRTVTHQFGITFPTLGYTMTGVIIGQVWTNLSFGVLLISSGLAGIPDSMIEAARDAGASLTRTVLRILVPMTTIPTVIVVSFTGIGVLGSFTVPYITGPNSPNMLGVAMTQSFQSFNHAQQATVMAIVIFVLAAGIGYLYVRAQARQARRSGLS